MEGAPSTFTWMSLGDIQVGRPNMGDMTNVMVYRLFQFSMRHILEQRFGIKATEDMLREAGAIAGYEFAASQLDCSKPIFEFIAELHDKLLDLKVGIMRVEKADVDRMEIVLTVSEDLDCSGLPILGRTVCSFDEGLIAGVLKRYTGRDFAVKEIDCWTTGAKTCRFTVRPKG
jgi:predicted hydrocarbon binding protein